MNNFTINCNGTLLDLSSPKIMGILNCTEDSFYDGGKYLKEKIIVERIEAMIVEGVDIIDVGGQSSRPKAKMLSADEEWKNIEKPLQLLQQKFPKVIISIDTFWSKNAQKSVDLGASIINDISAGNIDNNMLKTVAKLNTPYILMHMQGTPATMQEKPVYSDVVTEVNQFLSTKIYELLELGVNDIILDAGFGFGKTIENNFTLLNNLEWIGLGKYPLLVGISRKSMIYKTLQISAEEALNGTSALHMVALQKGSKILRVHDIKAAQEVVMLYNKLSA